VIFFTPLLDIVGNLVVRGPLGCRSIIGIEQHGERQENKLWRVKSSELEVFQNKHC